MSPTPSPNLPHRGFNYSTPHSGTYTHPGSSQSRRISTLLDRSFGSDSFGRYAFSEAPSTKRQQASTYVLDSVHRRSLRQRAVPQSVFANAAFQQNGEFSSSWNRKQSVVKEEKRTVQAQNGDMMLGAVQPDEGLSWLAQVRRYSRGRCRLNSHPPSFASIEVDMGRQEEAELPIQPTQAQIVTTA